LTFSTSFLVPPDLHAPYQLPQACVFAISISISVGLELKLDLAVCSLDHPDTISCSRKGDF